jgi:tetratricopeptide (TPR) repeat protein
MKTFHVSVDTLVQNLFELERKGLYQEAFEQVSEVWQDFNSLPDLDDVEPHTAAEFLLRSGSLLGFFGHTNQVPNSQEQSKNILSKARNSFLNLYSFEKVAECENYIALAYWRTGEIAEAETWVESSLFHSLPNSSRIKLYSYIVKSVILLSTNKPNEILSLLENLEDDFINFGDDVLRGDFYSYYASANRLLKRNEQALKSFELAKFYHQKGGHKTYFASIENNLANLYKNEQRFNSAHKSVDSAIETFREIKDRTREAYAYDTKASVYFAEEKYKEALDTIETGIRILKHGENKGYLVDSYQTKIETLVKLDRITDAHVCMIEAYQIAHTHIGENVAREILVKFEKLLKPTVTVKFKNTYDEKELTNYELVFDESINVKGEFNGVRIKNNTLEQYGLKRGLLAITVNEEINKGDLVAILEKENDLVICGFYDNDFGIICLDNKTDEPQLFNEQDVQMLGKIVGYCDFNERTSGKLLVNPIKMQ